MTERLYRRAPSLIAYWVGPATVVHDFVRHVEHRVGPAELSVLAELDTWQSVEDVRATTGLTDRTTRRLLARLRNASIVETSDGRIDPVADRLWTWDAWGPAATHFHFGTKDGTPAPGGLETSDGRGLHSRPPALKAPAGGRTIALPHYPRSGAFVDVLLARRTWRRFGKDRLTLEQLATVIGLTWGVQAWMKLAPGVQAPLKTSPSGGACHSIEVYVLAQRVKGLARGIYHYRPDAHALERVRPVTDGHAGARYLNGQQWFDGAAAVFFMTSVVERTRWKYTFPRAYRVLLLEAGHFCQTLCLVATWMKLAPFCSAALTDSRIERALGVDGVNEVLLYAAGVGTRPPKADEARWPSGAASVLSAPRHLRRSGRSSSD